MSQKDIFSKDQSMCFFQGQYWLLVIKETDSQCLVLRFESQNEYSSVKIPINTDFKAKHCGMLHYIFMFSMFNEKLTFQHLSWVLTDYYSHQILLRAEHCSKPQKNNYRGSLIFIFILYFIGDWLKSMAILIIKKEY